MAAPQPPPPPFKGGLSLYDNLLDPNEKKDQSTISSAPVLYNQAGQDAAVKKPIDPAFRFQPIRRPQPKQNKQKSSTKSSCQPANASNPAAAPAPAPAQPTQSTDSNPQPPQKSTLADWAAAEEDEWRYGTGEKRQRGGRKKKKKQHHVQAETDWDDLYDPARPTNVDEYLRSDEKIDEVREWKALLYRHRTTRKESVDSDDSEDESRPVLGNQFAPPPSYNFAPPPESPPAPPPESLPPPPPPQPPFDDGVTISAAPVRYETSNPSPKPKQDDNDTYSPPPAISTTSNPTDDQPKTSLPGQAGFASRLMKKYGWTSGTGLGASSTGIINPLHVQVEKRKKRPDSEGGGWADPANKAKILGGKRAANQSEDEGRGKMSEVIVLKNMLENLPDLEEEISAGLGQEIGEECGDKYGRVERLFIDPSRRLVFIKFTDQVSALRAVNELDGRVFNGNTIIPKFYDSEKFERGIYD